jgi:hypothetical protein
MTFSYFLRLKMEQIWNTPGVHHPCHLNRWQITSPEFWGYLYGIIHIISLRGRLSFPRTKTQVEFKYITR